MSRTELPMWFSGHARRMNNNLSNPVETAIHRFRQAAQRSQLSALSNRQLRDAGIDLSLAGRGKAVAVSAAALARLRSMG